MKWLRKLIEERQGMKYNIGKVRYDQISDAIKEHLLSIVPEEVKIYGSVEYATGYDQARRDMIKRINDL